MGNAKFYFINDHLQETSKYLPDFSLFFQSVLNMRCEEFQILSQRSVTVEIYAQKKLSNKRKQNGGIEKHYRMHFYENYCFQKNGTIH